MVRNHHKRAGDSRSQANPLPMVQQLLPRGLCSRRTHGKKDGISMYSLYRAHSTGAKGFHKRATQQGKQYKEAGTLFCRNGQNRTLCLPQHSRIYTQVSLQDERVLLDLVGLLSTKSMNVLACGPHPSIASPATPGGVEPQSPEITPWSPRRTAGGDSRTPSRATGSCTQGNVCIRTLGLKDQLYRQKLHDPELLTSLL